MKLLYLYFIVTQIVMPRTKCNYTDGWNWGFNTSVGSCLRAFWKFIKANIKRTNIR